MLDGSHPVLTAVAFQFRQTKLFKHRLDIVGKATAKAFRQPIPMAHGIVEGTSPGLDCAIFDTLLLVTGDQRHPIAVGLEHGMQIVKAAEVIAYGPAAHLADKRRRIRTFVGEWPRSDGECEKLPDPWDQLVSHALGVYLVARKPSLEHLILTVSPIDEQPNIDHGGNK